MLHGTQVRSIHAISTVESVEVETFTMLHRSQVRSIRAICTVESVEVGTFTMLHGSQVMMWMSTWHGDTFWTCVESWVERKARLNSY